MNVIGKPDDKLRGGRRRPPRPKAVRSTPRRWVAILPSVASLKIGCDFGPGIIHRAAAPERPSLNASNRDSMTSRNRRSPHSLPTCRPGHGESDSYHHAIAGKSWLPLLADLRGEP